MALGVGLEFAALSVTGHIQEFHLVEIGLIAIMYPLLAKADYSQLRAVFSDWRVLGLSLVQNWVIGPTLMFGLAVIFFSGLVPGLPTRPEFFFGLVFIGMARCIAMVFVWNELAEGSTEYVTGLVAFNSLFQIITDGVYIWVFALFLPPLLGMETLVTGIETFSIISLQPGVDVVDTHSHARAPLGIPIRRRPPVSFLVSTDEALCSLPDITDCITLSLIHTYNRWLRHTIGKVSQKALTIPGIRMW